MLVCVIHFKHTNTCTHTNAYTHILTYPHTYIHSHTLTQLRAANLGDSGFMIVRVIHFEHERSLVSRLAFAQVQCVLQCVLQWVLGWVLQCVLLCMLQCIMH